jgi:tRNA modification GTPase
LEEITKVKYGLETNLPSDLMAIDIKGLVSFGTITGQVTNDELR